MYSMIWILFFILVLFHYLYKDFHVIFPLFIIYNDYHSLCDYIIIDMIIFLFCLFFGRVMGLSLISMILFVFIMMLFPFFFCFLGMPLLSMMLLYKDNYPYVVIEIYFHFMFVFLGVYDNIWDSMFLYFSYIM